MKKTVAFDEVKQGHTFNENTYCQIINLVINDVDSKFSTKKNFKNLGPVLVSHFFKLVEVVHCSQAFLAKFCPTRFSWLSF